MGRTNVGSAVYKITADTKKYQTEFDAAGKVTDKFKGQSRAMVSAVAAIDGPLGGIGSRVRSLNNLVTTSNLLFASLAIGVSGLTFAAARSVRELSKFEQAQFRTEAMLRATGNASGYTAKQLEEMAQKIAFATLASTEGVRAAQSSLLSFSSVSEPNFERSLRLAQDMAAVFGGDIKSNVEKIGRALQNPEKRLAGLERTVGALDDKQRELAISTFRAGDALGAQAIILDEIANKVGGAGEGEAQGLAGQIDTLGQSMENLFITMGKSGTGQAFSYAIGNIIRSVQALDDSMKPSSLEENIQKRQELIDQLNNTTPYDNLLFSNKLSLELLKQRIVELDNLIAKQEEQAEVEKDASIDAYVSMLANQKVLEIKRETLRVEKDLDKERTKLLRSQSRIQAGVGTPEQKENRLYEQNIADLKRMQEINLDTTIDYDRLIEQETERHVAALYDIRSRQKIPKTLFDTALEDSRKNLLSIQNDLLSSPERELKQVQQQIAQLDQAYAFGLTSYGNYVNTKKRLEQQATNIQTEISSPTSLFLDNFENLRNNHLQTEAEEQAHYERRIALLREFERERPSQKDAVNQAIEAETLAHERRVTTIQRQEEQSRLRARNIFASAASTLMNSQSRKLFEIGKAAAISSAIVNTALGVTEALKLGPIIGPPLAAMQAAAGIVQIQQINSTSFGSGATGGSIPSTPSINNNAPTSVPLSEQTSGRDIQINFNGDFNGLTPEFIDQLADGISERINEADLVIIESGSRQAQELVA